MFDIILISKNNPNNILSFTSKFPFIKISASLEEAKKLSMTKMFWAITENTIVNKDFNFDIKIPEWDQKYVHCFKNGDFYDGVFLIPKDKEFSKKELEYLFFVDKKQVDLEIGKPIKYDKFVIDTYDEYLYALEHSTTEMFWATSRNIKVVDDFKFDLYFNYQDSYNRKENHAFIHQVENEDFYNGVFLFSKHKPVTKKEIEHRHLIERKEWDVIGSTKIEYNKYFINSYNDYLYALEHSTTEMFWVINKNVKSLEEFKFDLYFNHSNNYDRTNNHVFKNLTHNNETTFDGVFLLSKHKLVTKKEIEHRHLIERKEWDVIASQDKFYDKFLVDTYDEYLYALEHSTTEMFWATSRNIKVVDDFKFDVFFDFRTDEFLYHRKENHAFIHRVENENFYNGVFLFSKHKPVTKKEIEHRHLIERKEWDVIASGPVSYDKFIIDTYDEYLYALKNSKTEMFWATSRNIKVVDDFKFDLYFNHNNNYDRKNNHAFIHRVENENFYNGVFLFSKHKPVTKKEIEHRHLIERKEWDVIASGPVSYDKFVIDTYDDYLYALEHATTEMFWVIPKELLILDDFKFDLYFNHNNEYDRNENHSFLNIFRKEPTFNGIHLLSKKKTISEKEIKYRFVSSSKKHNIVASKLKKYDIVFISYNELNAEDNYRKLLSRYPDAKRVDKVKGIHRAHVKAAEVSETENFWVVDGDALILDTFNFSYEIPVWDRDVVHIWHSINPINNLEYGYGGVKLLPRKLTLSMDVNSIDMTTSISKKIKVIEEVSNYTAFNTDPFNTWKSAFRESVKLLSNTISNADKNSTERYRTWATVGADKPFGEYAIKGAVDAKEFVEQGGSLGKINDFEYLYERFNNKI